MYGVFLYAHFSIKCNVLAFLSCGSFSRIAKSVFLSVKPVADFSQDQIRLEVPLSLSLS